MKNRSSYQRVYHREHITELKAQHKAWGTAHKAERKAYRIAHEEEIRVYNKTYYIAHRAGFQTRGRLGTQALKLEVLQRYSGEHPRCAYCGINDLVVLTIDHINNDGAEHRKTIGGGIRLYRWLKKNNYPKGFQVLCRNCNFRKYYDSKK